MTKKYFYIALLLTCLFSLSAVAQESRGTSVAGKEPIEGLNIYPNPAKADRIYVTTAKPSISKEIEIYNTVGNRVMQVTLNGGAKELNISSLSRGMYFVKVKEGDASATRKLMVE
ncbi:T9SS type A sorting domain-containing protein [Flavobacterium sp. AG291]|uniref:T9SS type A sorting domain-containing protein n=1 Tax=Flavobacterium sp. AG291 TaxID=2184000 RepID=UPI000E0BE21B|nr:T9SS type A sorting domain-containing protein [Flavobacterium sp. AG291]RDI15739.1 putative secreted protein (Por secretion system target) [Flavobacterium sp. AG291]